MKYYVNILLVFLIQSFAFGQETGESNTLLPFRQFSYYNVTGTSLYFGQNGGRTYEMTNGLMFREKWGAGIGIGVLRNYNYSLSTIAFESTWHLSAGRSHLSLTLKTGYISSNNRMYAPKSREGYFAGGSVAMNIYLGKRFYLQSSLGIRHDLVHRYPFITTNWEGDELLIPKEILRQNVVEMRLSIFFY